MTEFVNCNGESATNLDESELFESAAEDEDTDHADSEKLTAIRLKSVLAENAVVVKFLKSDLLHALENSESLEKMIEKMKQRHEREKAAWETKNQVCEMRIALMKKEIAEVKRQNVMTKLECQFEMQNQQNTLQAFKEEWIRLHLKQINK